MKGNLMVLARTVIGIVILGMFGCKSDSENPGTSGQSNLPPNTIAMSASVFSPATITVTAGTTITWQNFDNIVHTSTSDSTGWNTGDIQPGASKTAVFNTQGTFKYHCTYHRAMGMVGTVIVQ